MWLRVSSLVKIKCDWKNFNEYLGLGQNQIIKGRKILKKMYIWGKIQNLAEVKGANENSNVSGILDFTKNSRLSHKILFSQGLPNDKC